MKNKNIYKEDLNQKKYITIGNLIFILLLSISINFLFFNIYYEESPVLGTSMIPTLNESDSINNDIVFLKKTKTVSYGDIVIINKSNNVNEERIIKRVIAIENDKIGLSQIDGEYLLTLNNMVLYEDYILKTPGAFSGLIKNEYGMAHYLQKFATLYDENKCEKINDSYVLTVPENCIFVLGDNRKDSVASETFGCFNKNALVGKVDYKIKGNQNKVFFIILRLFCLPGSSFGKI